MSATNAARKVDVPDAPDSAAAFASSATDAFVTARALEILREWASSPEIEEIMAEAERVKAADAARRN